MERMRGPPSSRHAKSSSGKISLIANAIGLFSLLLIYIYIFFSFLFFYMFFLDDGTYVCIKK